MRFSGEPKFDGEANIMNDYLEVRIPISPREYFFNRIRVIALSIHSLGGGYENTRFRISVGADSDPEDLYIRCPWSRLLNIEWVWLKKEVFNKWKNTENEYLATIVDRFSPPYSAKNILILDPDVLVVNKFDEIIWLIKKNNGIAGVPAHRSPVAYDSVISHQKWWNDLYSLAGINGTPSFTCQHSGWGIMELDQTRRMSPPYFNSGMILGTASAFERFYNTYLHMLDVVSTFEDTYFIDQIAMTLALEKNKINTNVLPLRYNFPNQKEFDEKFPLELQNVRFIHFLRTNVIDRDSDFDSLSSIKKLVNRNDLHGSNEIFRKKVSDIYSLLSTQENEEISLSNSMPLSAQGSQRNLFWKNVKRFFLIVFDKKKSSFDYLTFWNSYYSDKVSESITNPLLEIDVYKASLLESIICEVKPESILDIGCGDMTIGFVLPDHDYLGLDISQVAIKSNMSAYPNRKFICGNFLSIEIEKKEFVLCLDVLQHIPHRDDYLAFVEKCVKTTGVVGVVSGYEGPPETLSNINFYHEPLSHTLRECGAVDIKQIGAYNEYCVFQFRVKNTSADRWGTLKDPIFLVGTDRSGTTVLAELLGKSPYVAYCPFELKDIWSRVGKIPMASPKTRDLDCPEYFGESASLNMRKELTMAFEERINILHGKHKDAIFLNKNPHLSNKLGLVTSLFPDARIIWTYRHMIQVVASVKKLFTDVYHRQQTRHWWPQVSVETRNRCWSAIYSDEEMEAIPADRIFPGGDVYYIAEYWLETNRAISEFLTETLNTRCIQVEQEQFVASPEIEVARLYGSLKLPFFQIKHFNLDRERNRIWKEILNQKEISSLLRFLGERGHEIEKIFPGELRLSLYLRQLEGASEMLPIVKTVNRPK